MSAARLRSPVSTIIEDDLHFALAEWLTKYARIKGSWWHTPNTSSSIPYAMKLKRMGRKAGVFDFQFMRYPNFSAFIELKLHPNNLSDDQEIFCANLIRMGVPYAVIRTRSPEATIAQAQTFLRENGFISA